jgi:hypothetical protein
MLMAKIIFDGVEVDLPDGQNYTEDRVRNVIRNTFNVNDVNVEVNEDGNFVGSRIVGEKA